MIAAAEIARDGVKANYGKCAAVHLRGRHVERRLPGAPRDRDRAQAVRRRRRLGRHVHRRAGPNLLTDLPPAILNFPDYVASGCNPDSTAAKNIRAAGYPPDIVGFGATGLPTSLWANYWASFWEVTQCQWQKRFDPTYDTYGSTAATRQRTTT